MTGNRFKLGAQLRKAMACANVLRDLGVDADLASFYTHESRALVAQQAGVTYPSDETWDLVVGLLSADEQEVADSNGCPSKARLKGAP